MPPSMKRLPRLLSHVFAPTILVTVLLALTPLRFPQVAWGQALLATTFTTLIPWAVLGWARARGKVTDVHVTRREQRWPLLLVALASILGGLTLMIFTHAEPVMIREVLLILAGLLVTGVITLVWKVSIHVAVAAFVFLHAFAEQPWGPYLAVAMVAVTSWSRVQLAHHTSSQVFAGAIIGALVGMLGLIPLSG
jgi:membrane-associated phospholipid phosphatase